MTFLSVITIDSPFLRLGFKPDLLPFCVEFAKSRQAGLMLFYDFCFCFNMLISLLGLF